MGSYEKRLSWYQKGINFRKKLNNKCEFEKRFNIKFDYSLKQLQSEENINLIKINISNPTESKFSQILGLRESIISELCQRGYTVKQADATLTLYQKEKYQFKCEIQIQSSA